MASSDIEMAGAIVEPEEEVVADYGVDNQADAESGVIPVDIDDDDSYVDEESPEKEEIYVPSSPDAHDKIAAELAEYGIHDDDPAQEEGEEVASAEVDEATVDGQEYDDGEGYDHTGYEIDRSMLIGGSTRLRTTLAGVPADAGIQRIKAWVSDICGVVGACRQVFLLKVANQGDNHRSVVISWVDDDVGFEFHNSCEIREGMRIYQMNGWPVRVLLCRIGTNRVKSMVASTPDGSMDSRFDGESTKGNSGKGGGSSKGGSSKGGSGKGGGRAVLESREDVHSRHMVDALTKAKDLYWQLLRSSGTVVLGIRARSEREYEALTRAEDRIRRLIKKNTTGEDPSEFIIEMREKSKAADKAQDVADRQKVSDSIAGKKSPPMAKKSPPPKASAKVLAVPKTVVSSAPAKKAAAPPKAANPKGRLSSPKAPIPSKKAPTPKSAPKSSPAKTPARPASDAMAHLRRPRVKAASPPPKISSAAPVIPSASGILGTPPKGDSGVVHESVGHPRLQGLIGGPGYIPSSPLEPPVDDAMMSGFYGRQSVGRNLRDRRSSDRDLRDRRSSDRDRRDRSRSDRDRRHRRSRSRSDRDRRDRSRSDRDRRHRRSSSRCGRPGSSSDVFPSRDGRPGSSRDGPNQEDEALFREFLAFKEFKSRFGDRR